MQFVHPNFLWALSLVALPIIIHLFHFRTYKKVQFTNIAFLKELQKETRSYQKLRNILVLIARIFAICFLVFAFAQPYIPVSENTQLSESENVYLYVDNSFSMEAIATQGPVIETARETARRIIKAYSNSQEFQVITNDRDYGSRSLNREDALSAIDEIESSPFQLSPHELLKTVQYRNQRSSADKNRLYWISDYQSAQDIDEADPIQLDSSTIIHMIPLKSQQRNNLAIDSVWLEDPIVQIDKPIDLFVALHNYGQSDIEAAGLNLLVNGRNSSVVGFDLSAGAKSTINMSFIPSIGGWKNIELKIEDKSIYFDDSYFTSLNVRSSVSILEIAGPDAGSSIGRLFSTDSYFEHRKVQEGNIQVGSLKSFDFIVLNEPEDVGSGLIQNLIEFCREGGSLLLIPNQKGENENLNQLCKSLGLPEYGDITEQELKVSDLALDDPLLAKVFEKIPDNPDFPSSSKYYSFSRNSAPISSLMKLTGGRRFLHYLNFEQGKVFQVAVPFQEEFSNFHKHALFVPIVLKMAFNRSVEYPLAYTLERDIPLIKGIPELSQYQSELEVSNDKNSWIPVVQAQGGRTRVDLGDEIEEAGFYQIKKGDSLLQSVALNFDRAESTSKYYNLDDIKSVAQGSSVELWENDEIPVDHRIEEIQFGKRFWKSCIVLALLFLGIEILLLRFWRKKAVEPKVVLQ